MRKGVTTLEYSLLITAIGLTCILSITHIGQNARTLFMDTHQGLIKANANDDNFGLSQSDVSHGRISGWSCSSTDECHGLPLGTMRDAATLSLLNQQSPVTEIYGIIDHNGNPVTHYEDALTALNNNNAIGSNTTNYDSYHDGIISETPVKGYYRFEALTQDGNIYGIFYSDGHLGYQNLITGETYLDNSTNTPENVGSNSNISQKGPFF